MKYKTERLKEVKGKKEIVVVHRQTCTSTTLFHPDVLNCNIVVAILVDRKKWTTIAALLDHPLVKAILNSMRQLKYIIRIRWWMENKRKMISHFFFPGAGGGKRGIGGTHNKTDKYEIEITFVLGQSSPTMPFSFIPFCSRYFVDLSKKQKLLFGGEYNNVSMCLVWYKTARSCIYCPAFLLPLHSMSWEF